MVGLVLFFFSHGAHTVALYSLFCHDCMNYKDAVFRLCCSNLSSSPAHIRVGSGADRAPDSGSLSPDVGGARLPPWIEDHPQRPEGW